MKRPSYPFTTIAQVRLYSLNGIKQKFHIIESSFMLTAIINDISPISMPVRLRSPSLNMSCISHAFPNSAKRKILSKTETIRQDFENIGSTAIYVIKWEKTMVSIRNSDVVWEA